MTARQTAERVIEDFKELMSFRSELKLEALKAMAQAATALAIVEQTEFQSRKARAEADLRRSGEL